MMWLNVIATVTALAALLTALATLWQVRLTSKDPSPYQFARIARASERAVDTIETYFAHLRIKEEDRPS